MHFPLRIANMKELGLRVLPLILLVAYSNGLQSPPTCSSEGVECQYSDNNLIDSVSQVHSEEECRLICEDQQRCNFITFFNASSIPFSNFCRLFNTCENTEECENCVTQNLDCYRTCGYNFVGHMDENIIDTINNTKSELDCKMLCSQTLHCLFYTYYSEEDNHYHGLESKHPPGCSSSRLQLSENGHNVHFDVNLSFSWVGLTLLRKIKGF